ncbi:MAG: hypothetical protein M3Z24_03450 [Chloroflexota bacterium]|nr:hypothetical protein [Chloroflexota bacterium]
MPGYLLHVGAIVLCSHGGMAQPLIPYPRVTVSGQPVVLQTTPYAVAGCPYIVVLVPVPCVTATWLTGSLRVKANGLPLLLQDSQAITAPNGVPLDVVFAQIRVKGM